MTTQEFKGGVARFAVAFSHDVSDALAAVYLDGLKDLDGRDFAEAVRIAARRCKFFPRVAELREIAEEMRRDRLAAEREERNRRAPVAAIPAEVSDPAENRKHVAALLASLKAKMAWS